MKACHNNNKLTITKVTQFDGMTQVFKAFHGELRTFRINSLH